MDQAIRVLLADDHPLVRAGIRTTLLAESEFALAGEATSGDEVRQLCGELQPDILLLDVQMPGPPAVQTVTWLRAQHPDLRIVVLTAYDNDVYVRGLISAGAVGYVLKDEAPQVVVRAIRTVMQGDTWFSRPVVEKMARLGVNDAPGTEPSALTERERQVLRQVAKGDTNKQIGKTLGISAKAVEKHLSEIFAKLNLPSRSAAAAWAVSKGLE